MSEVLSEDYKQELEASFEPDVVKYKDNGFQINCQQLGFDQILSLATGPLELEILVKRSGTGLAVIGTVKPSN